MTRRVRALMLGTLLASPGWATMFHVGNLSQGVWTLKLVHAGGIDPGEPDLAVLRQGAPLGPGGLLNVWAEPGQTLAFWLLDSQGVSRCIILIDHAPSPSSRGLVPRMVVSIQAGHERTVPKVLCQTPGLLVTILGDRWLPEPTAQGR